MSTVNETDQKVSPDSKRKLGWPVSRLRTTSEPIRDGDQINPEDASSPLIFGTRERRANTKDKIVNFFDGKKSREEVVPAIDLDKTESNEFVTGETSPVATSPSSPSGPSSSSSSRSSSLKSLFGFVGLGSKTVSKSFEVPLDQCPRDSKGYPAVFSMCWHVMCVAGPVTEGIFRIPGQAAQVEALRERLNSNFASVDLFDENIHEVSSVMKRWIRELPQPLIPAHLIPEFQIAQADVEKTRFHALLTQLPRLHGVVLTQLFELLRFISLYHEKNKMTARNLALVFAPELFRMEFESVSSGLTATEQGLVTFVIGLIEDFEAHFYPLRTHFRYPSVGTTQ
eukprot:c3533_g1_i1.p1 GENE.c3533_g1_i1~~c3533_g1_i1.p1  ORF type:complete len:340 (-),score=62.85 c3533_g1_i1:33-1052(-)